MRNIASKIIGSKFFHEDCNSMASEEMNLVLTSGQSLIEGDSYQISKATAIYNAAGNFYTDSGSANHYVLSAMGSRQVPIAYVDGMSIRFRTSNANTGVSDINVAGLGVRTIKKEDGAYDLGAGDILANHVNELVYNASTGFFELYSHKYQDQTFRTGWFTFTIENVAPDGWLIYGNPDQTVTTIGDASSGAIVRANADCEALFKMIWANIIDDNCPVIGGRGASPAADWSAHKKICLPYIYKRTFASGYYFSNIAQCGGQDTQSLGNANNGAHPHTYSAIQDGGSGGFAPGSYHVGGGTYNTSSSGSGTPFSIYQPTIWLYTMMKL